MKILKGFLNFFGIVLAVILSIVLLATLIATPVVSSATNVFNPKTLTKVISSIDYEQLIEDMATENGAGDVFSELPPEYVQSLMSSNTFKDVVELYSQDIISALNNADVEKSCTPEATKAILTENFDEFCDIIFEIVSQEDLQITKEEVRTQLSDNLDELASELANAFPSPEEAIGTESMDEQTRTALSGLASGSFKAYIIIAAVVLSLLIYGCRFVRFKGFIWLAVIYFLSALSAFTARIVSPILLESLAGDALLIPLDALKPALSVALSQFIIVGVVLLVLAAACITAFVFGRKNHLKKQRLAFAVDTAFTSFSEQPAGPVAPAQAEEVVQAEETAQTETPTSEEA